MITSAPSTRKYVLSLTAPLPRIRIARIAPSSRDSLFFHFPDRQIEFVWSGPWSLGKFLFLANRYSPFIDTFISLHRKQSLFRPVRAHRYNEFFALVLTSFESPEVNPFHILQKVIETHPHPQ